MPRLRTSVSPMMERGWGNQVVKLKGALSQLLYDHARVRSRLDQSSSLAISLLASFLNESKASSWYLEDPSQR